MHGLGIASNPDRSATLLNWRDDEGHQGLVQPYILDHLPVNLWGRDVMEGMDLKLTLDIPFSSLQANTIMLAQGHIWGKGLGNNQQGITNPTEPQKKENRTGLGFH